ncbi:uncharacterized protein LOC122016830 isoform X2 [Zingiber officinale]|uniref:uncharacterized protein LOC122016830 isoform X2 n=1 Tax=Zingiber officinale TaxID=94328 RepID=UPI001C4BCAEA|nr:uncharacterized protein LOC122016830 isoform X2 [Zingiber officinale]
MLHSLVRRHALPPSTQLRCVFFSTGTYVSSSGTTASPDPHFMVEYLVNTWGFSADDASKVSKSLPCFQSTEKPDAVLGFFRSHGLDGANLRKIISWRPGFLCGDVENSLAPKFKILRDMGLSESDIANAVLRHPFILYLDAQNALLPRLKAWESLFGSKEILLRNLRGYNRFLSASIENVIELRGLEFLEDLECSSGFLMSCNRVIAEKDGIFGQCCWKFTFRRCSPPGTFSAMFGKEINSSISCDGDIES